MEGCVQSASKGSDQKWGFDRQHTDFRPSAIDPKTTSRWNIKKATRSQLRILAVAPVKGRRSNRGEVRTQTSRRHAQ